MTSDLSDVIRFISDRISDYEKPEYMSKWADKAMKELPSRRYALSSRDSKRKRWKRKSKSISDRIKWVLNKVEKLEDFSLMEKLQLAFIFSRPVSDEFVQLLKDAKFKIEQDKKKRIRRFSTEDESIIRFSDHEARVKYFQGVLCRTSTIQKNKNLSVLFLTVRFLEQFFSRERMSRQKKQSQQAVANETPSPEVSAATNEYFVIRYISDRISDYEKPEGFTKWCQKAMKGVSPRSFSCMRASVRDKLGRIEKLDGFSLMEKLQLVFIFSRSVSDEFVQILKDAKFEIEQDERNRICRFLTEDGSIVRFSDHHPNVKYFEGVLCLNSNLQKNANK
ncbi:hypothetical protein B9Z55_021183 [Caenorhabditis nigoni]|nr:hypothetical protein B9Z55_021183 [Caenorhabditis nigoni]